MAERERTDVAGWIGGIAVGSAAIVGVYTVREQKEKSAAIENKLPPTLSDLTLDNSLHSFGLFSTPEAALSAVKTKGVSNIVAEFGSPDGNIFTYAFQVNPATTNTPSLSPTNSAPFLLLRGVQDGKERSSLLTEIAKEGGEVRARISLPHNGSLTATASGDSHPWYYDLASPLMYSSAFVFAAYLVGKAFKEISNQDVLGFGDGLQKLVERPKERFTDVGGNQTAVAEMKALVHEISRYQRGESRATLPKGILMSGDPGTGKTFLARVLCGEASCPMMYMNAGDLASAPFIGSWTAAVKRMFRQARKLRDEEATSLQAKHPGATVRPVIALFIDEFDSIGRNRDDRTARFSESEHIKAVNTLLAEMDGVDSRRNEGILIVAATNSAESIDPALKRPGRFTLQLSIPLPATVEERLDILQKVTPKILSQRELTLQQESSLSDLAKATGSISPDHLRGIIDRAAELARRADSPTVTAQEIFAAFQEVSFGHAYDGLAGNRERRAHVAWHEHGHGILAVACGCAPLVISMRPRGESLGRVVIDNHPLREPTASRDDLLKALLILAGGRAGEMTRAGISGAGAGVESDFKIMEQIARTIIDSGMLDGGFGGRHQAASFWDLPETIQSRIKNLCTEAISEARMILNVVGHETLEKIVEDTLRLERELVGDEARSFYAQFLSQEQHQKLHDLVDTFVSKAR